MVNKPIKGFLNFVDQSSDVAIKRLDTVVMVHVR